jgi:cation:H+ antiporter
MHVHMILLFWIAVFIVALVVLVKGADYLVESAEKVGLSFGLSPFIVGVTIVGIGTSFPELIASFAALLQGVPEVIAANAVGSNIANILLVVGVAAVIGKRLSVTKNLIDTDLPLLGLATILAVWALIDGTVTFGEALLLVVAYAVYFAYTLLDKSEQTEGGAQERPRVGVKEYVLLLVGIGGLLVGAHFLIASLKEIATIIQIGAGVIAITAVAIGTSLPELLVSAKAALKGKAEVALGNIFGSNIFNALMVIGLPGLFATLAVDADTLAIGLPTVAIATLVFTVSGISRSVHAWEGAFFLCVYAMFVGKLFGVL